MKKNYISLVLLLVTLAVSSQEYKRMIATGTYSVQEIQEEAEQHFVTVGTERGKGYKPYKRWEYNALRNMDVNGKLKTPEFYFNELENLNKSQNTNNDVNLRTTVGSWEALGPVSWNATSGWNPGVGRVTSIAIESGNEDHIIVGGESGGVWKTTDGGVNWTVLTDNLSNIYVYSLAIDPTNSLTYFWGSTDGTIFKSTDGGSTWNLLASTGSGNVNKILVDPANTNKMYCSIEGGGLYKTTNAGVNWSLIDASATNGYDVEFKPGTNGNVIYASGNNFYKSVDGGATFQFNNPLASYTQEYISGTVNWSSASTNQNNTVSAKTGDKLGLFYSGNFNDDTTQLILPALNLTGASNPRLKFSYTTVNWDGDVDELKILYKTSLNGAWIELANYTTEVTNWLDIDLSLPAGSSEYYIAFESLSNWGRGLTLDDISVEDASLGMLFQNGFESTNVYDSGPKMIGVSEDDNTIVYVLEADGGVFGGLYKSIDSGDNFVKLNHGNNNYFGYSSTASDNSGQAPRDMDIAVSPTNINEVHIAGVLTWRSTNGGSSFNITSQWTLTNASAENIGYCHADVDLLMFEGSNLYVGSDGGIFVAENTANVNTSYYRDLTPGLGIRQFYRFGVSQTSPEVVTGGAQDNGTSVMDTSGNWTDWLGADGMESFVDKNNNNILYGTSQNGSLYKSTNGGASYFGLSSPGGNGNWITPFEQDPITPNVIYSGYSQVYKSTNGGSSWSSISQNLGGNLDHLKIAPSNNAIMYASRGGLLYKTTNGGASNWTSVTGFDGSINSIAVHPLDPNKVAIATTGDQKVYVSTNGGTTWTSYLNNLPDFSALALVWQNNAMDGLYVGMNYGIYYIDNAHTDWQAFSNNLPNVQISELEINTATNKIYAATYGRGVWRSNVFEATLSVEELSFNTLSVFPNPANNEINLSWNKNEEVSIKIYNALGKLMYFSKDQNLSNTLKIDVANYASGFYFIKVNNSEGITTKKIVIN